jgi:chaperone required for assembly of F1-ATPase
MEPTIATGIFILGVAFATLRPDLQAEKDAEAEKSIQQQYQQNKWIEAKEQSALKKKRAAFKMPPVL